VSNPPKIVVVTMPLSALVIDADVQPRVDGLHPPTVKEYRERYKAGDTFPPLVAYGTKKKAIVSEGFHRAEVYRLEEVAEVDVELREGGKEEAKLNALGSNKNHGLRRSNADKRRAVETALSMRPKWSDRKIADHCGVHHQMVADARSQLDDSSSSQPQQREGKDGKVRTVPAKPKEPELSSDDSSDTADGPTIVHSSPTPHRADGQRIYQLGDEIPLPVTTPDRSQPVKQLEPETNGEAEQVATREQTASEENERIGNAMLRVIMPPATDVLGIPIQDHAKEAFAAVPEFKELVKAIKQVQRLFHQLADKPGGAFLRLPGISAYRRFGKRENGTYDERFIHEGLELAAKQVANAMPTNTVCPYQFAEAGHPKDCNTCLNNNWTPALSSSVPPACIERAKEKYGV